MLLALKITLAAFALNWLGDAIFGTGFTLVEKVWQLTRAVWFVTLFVWLVSQK